MEVEDSLFKLISIVMRTLLLFPDLVSASLVDLGKVCLLIRVGWLAGGWRGSWGTTVSWLLLIALPCPTSCIPSICLRRKIQASGKG